MQNKRVIALGFFDGVHVGHGALLRQTVCLAGSLGLRSCVLSFDRHPSALLCGKSVPLLNTMAEREFLIKRQYGVEEVLFAHFDTAMMSLPWQDFVTDHLVRKLHAAHLVCGHDFRFGFRGEGTPQKLAELCERLRIGCSVVEKVTLNGNTVSSTLIRSLLLSGDAAQAAQYLGHAHLISGAVRGGTLTLEPDVLVPHDGCYLAQSDDGARVRLRLCGGGLTMDDQPDQALLRLWLKEKLPR